MKELLKLCGEISIFALAPVSVAGGIAFAEWLFRAVI